MNVLIATSPTSPTFSTSPTCHVDLKEKKDIIKRLEEVIYKDKKNQEVLEQRLTKMSERLMEMGESLQQKDDYISNLEGELHGFQ